LKKKIFKESNAGMKKLMAALDGEEKPEMKKNRSELGKRKNHFHFICGSIMVFSGPEKWVEA